MVAVEIVILRIIAAVTFLIALVLSIQLYHKTKFRTNVWLLISLALLVATGESVANALQWAGLAKSFVDLIGEILNLCFSVIWVYIAYRFITAAKGDKK